jgi:septum site-determining protein MinD
VIVAVAGGKGGVGKSTVAFNLGAALGAVVVDADLGMADLPCGRGPDLHDVLAGRADPVEAVRGGPVAVLPCGRSLAGARASDLTALADALRAVERAHGDVVVDCPAGMRADAGVPLAAADCCVLVASQKRFAFVDAVRTRELARELRTGLCCVVVNRAGADVPASVIERTLGAPTEALPEDPRVAASLAEAAPVVADCPRTRAAAAFRRVASVVQSCKSR